MSLTIEQRAEMRRVAEAATPGEWIDRTRSSDGLSAGFVCIKKGDHAFMLVAAGTWDDFWSDDWGSRPEHLPANVNANNAKFIATFHPAAAISLLDQLAEREREVAELREALSRHLSPTACDYRGGTHCITHGDERPCRHEVTRGLLECGR